LQKKEAKGQAMIYKILHRKLQIEQHEPPLKSRCSGREPGSNFCSTCGTHHGIAGDKS